MMQRRGILTMLLSAPLVVPVIVLAGKAEAKVGPESGPDVNELDLFRDYYERNDQMIWADLDGNIHMKRAQDFCGPDDCLFVKAQPNALRIEILNKTTGSTGYFWRR